MTAYSDFIQDFPDRCIDVLNSYIEDARKTNREVTLMLSVASAAITIPYERLRSEDHVAGDAHTYEDESGKRFNKVIEARFSSFPGHSKGWECIGPVEKSDFDAGIDSVMKGQRFPLPADYTLNTVLARVRNALAHGSIFTYPSQAAEIVTIVFVSEVREYNKSTCKNEPTGRYNVMLVSPDDFLVFLREWVEFLKGLNLKT